MANRRLLVCTADGLRHIVGVLPRGQNVPPTLGIGPTTFQLLRQTNRYLLYTILGTARAPETVNAPQGGD